MPEYINTETLEYPLYERDIKALYPNTAFPKPFVAPAPFAIVFETPQPMHNQYTQSVRKIDPALTAKGHYEQQWEVVNVTMEPEAYTAILDSLKADKLQAVQAEKVRARDGGFMVGGTLFDSDISARTSYTELGLRLSQNPSFETQWKASAGQWVVMDAALYSQVVIAGEAHITAVFAWQAAKEIEIGNCETVEELEAVDITYA